MDKKTTDNAFNRKSPYGTTPEPTYAGALSFMRRKYTRELAGVDLVVSGVPLDTATTKAYDIGEITALAAAHLAMEMIYLYACRPA